MFPTGFAACSGTIAALCRRGDLVLSDELNGFDPDDIRLAESLAEAIGLALDNARLHRELSS